MSWANQLRLLTGAFEQLGSIVGGVLINAFKPFIQALNSVMGAVINFAQVVSDALGAIFGWEYQTGGGVAQDLELGAGAAEDIEDATGGAADNAKKLNKYIAAWHEVNNMTSNEGSKGSGGGGGAGGAGAGGDASGGEWVQSESLWEKYTSSIDTLYKLGDYIGDVLTDAMNSINWDSVYESARNFGAGLASFLNGLISPGLFGAVGTTIAGALNTALHFLDSFGTEFDWKNFGNSIAEGINKFFKKFDFHLLAKTFNTWALGILDTITTAISKVNWVTVGTKIGEAIEKIDFIKILGSVGKLVWTAIIAAITTWSNMFTAAPIETTLLTVLAAIKIAPGVIKGFENIKNMLDLINVGLKALAVTAAAHPVITALGIAITGIAVAISALNKNWNKKLAEEFEEFQERIGSNNDELQETADSLREVSNSTKEIVETAESDAGKLQTLADSYFELADQTTLTKDEQEKLRDYSQKLIEQCPVLAKAIDGVTGKYTTQKDEIQKLIQAQKDQMMADAYTKAMQEYADQMAQANVQMGIAEEKYNNNAQAISELKDAQEKLSNDYRDQNVWLAENQELFDKYNITVGEGENVYGALAKSISFYQKEQEELTESMGSVKKELKDAEENYSAAEAAANKYQKSSEENAKSSETFRQALSNLNTDLSNISLNLEQGFVEGLALDNFDITQLKEFFDSLAEGVPASAKQLQDAFKNIGLSLPDNLAISMEGKSAEIQASTSRILMSIQSGIQISEPQVIQLFSDLGYKIPAEVIDNFAEMEPNMQMGTLNLLGMIDNGYALTSGNLITLFDNFGYELPNTLATALQEMEPDVQQKAISLLLQISEAEESERGPLIEQLQNLGIGLSKDGLISGINSMLDESKTAGGDLVKSSASGANEESKRTGSGSFWEAGENAVAGYVNGMLSSSAFNSVANAGKSLAKKAIASVQKEQDSNSPSRKMEKLGKFLVEGYNQGIYSNMQSSIGLAEDWISGIMNTFNFKVPTIDLSVDTSKYQFKPMNINAGKLQAEMQQSLDYMFEAGNFIDYERLGEAVYQAQTQAMKENPVQIGDDDVFKSAQRGQIRYQRRTNKIGWAGI